MRRIIILLFLIQSFNLFAERFSVEIKSVFHDNRSLLMPGDTLLVNTNGQTPILNPILYLNEKPLVDLSAGINKDSTLNYFAVVPKTYKDGQPLERFKKANITLLDEKESLNLGDVEVLILPSDLIEIQNADGYNSLGLFKSYFITNRSKMELSNWVIYFGPNRMTKLYKRDGEPHGYSFKIDAVTLDGDSIKKLFYPNSESTFSTNIAIGPNLESSILLQPKATVIVDSARLYRMMFALVSILIILLLFYFIVKGNGLSFLKDEVPDMDQAPYSLARTQLAYWTLVVLIAYFVIWIATGEMVQVTAQVLMLLGIGAGTMVGAREIDQGDLSDKSIVKRHQENVTSKNPILHIASGSQGPSIHRMQNIFFAIAIGGYFLFSVFHNFRIPVLDNNLMVLMGISSGTYLAIKRGENKSTQGQLT